MIEGLALLLLCGTHPLGLLPLLQLVHSNLLVQDLLVYSSADLLQAGGLLLGEGLTHNLEAARLGLALGLREAFKDLIRQHDGLHVLQAPANWRRHIILAEDLIAWIKRCYHIHEPL